MGRGASGQVWRIPGALKYSETCRDDGIQKGARDFQEDTRTAHLFLYSKSVHCRRARKQARGGLKFWGGGAVSNVRLDRLGK